MQILEDQVEIAKAQALLSKRIQDSADEIVPVSIGFQGGNTDADVFYLRDLNFWSFFGEPPLEKSPGERYWNVFGIGRPFGMVNIVCEINPPKTGINRRVAGVFISSPPDKIFIAHRGIFNAYGRIPYETVRQRFNWNWTHVKDGLTHTDVMLIAELNSPDLPKRLSEFILEVKRFKEAFHSNFPSH